MRGRVIKRERHKRGEEEENGQEIMNRKWDNDVKGNGTIPNS